MPVQSPESSTLRLPKAIRERSERIRLMVEERRNPPATPAADPPSNTDPAPPAVPIKATTTSTEDPPAAATASGLPPGDPRHNDVGYWCQRAKAVFGMFERSRKDNEVLRGQVRELREQLRQKEASQPAAQADTDLESLFTAEERQQYGDDQLRLVARTADKIGAKRADAVAKPLRETIEEDRQAEAQRKWDDFCTRLVQLCPDAFEIDKTPEWNSWLKTVDERSGVTYFVQLKAHESRLDATGVARLFGQYKAEAGHAAPPPPLSDDPGTRKAPPQPPVTPRAGAGGGGDAPPTGPVLMYPTPAEIKQHYKLAKLNKLTPEQVQKFEARLVATQA